ncbi:MAG: hypothetical protein P1U57_04175, partial [Oleibacter sp.]|nr:hypothetical protein [Thalassolituus sp.]
MTTYRTAFADYLTIATGVSTIFSGLYAVTSGGSLMDSSTEIGYWDGYLKHAIATALTLMALYFFLDQSIKIARRIVESGNSALPRWLVFGIFYIGGMVFFCVFQVLFQSKVF